jgi:hypothetical protein
MPGNAGVTPKTKSNPPFGWQGSGIFP